MSFGPTVRLPSPLPAHSAYMPDGRAYSSERERVQSQLALSENLRSIGVLENLIQST